MILLEVEGEEAPRQELQHPLPPTSSASHHSKTCSDPLILPDGGILTPIPLSSAAWSLTSQIENYQILMYCFVCHLTQHPVSGFCQSLAQKHFCCVQFSCQCHRCSLLSHS
uniref:Uncharacterized protein n=1 Tax=Arundo donax TaxID=35708 RepID=A0A0A9GH55_ARUDO